MLGASSAVIVLVIMAYGGSVSERGDFLLCRFSILAIHNGRGWAFNMLDNMPCRCVQKRKTLRHEKSMWRGKKLVQGFSGAYFSAGSEPDETPAIAIRTSTV